MRLTCPTCSAVYELPDDQLPAGGSHVQCSACHTRWFARVRPVSAERPSEDEIIARLETREARRGEPEDAGAPAVAPAVGPATTIAFPGPTRPVPQPPRPATAPDPAPPAAARPAPAAETSPAAAEPASVRATEPAATPLRPRPERPTAPAARVEAEPPRRRGGLAGFLAALALVAAAGGVYVRADAVATGAPALAAAVEAYADRVDAARDWLETRAAPIRDRLSGA